ncbi:hypothetical protein DPMN_141377 [Dreissena polymorpha]|uniref:C1q domain-containing protein n=1 Tax=Dreissena polymorpha TaxID=45954 RepID=A0A9D4G9C8_DREPO|nr:hypothetical protein DPMN_141377 [Dreissena polymorpha]
MKVALFVLNLVVASLAAELACPVCSRYNYEEMLLERVIRNELALEHTLKDIKETNTKVVDALRKLQDENDKVNIAIEVMERKQIVMEAALSDAIKTVLTNVSESLTHMLTELSQAIKGMEGRVDLLKIPTIQFRAKLASSITVNSGQDVVFARVEVNKGQGYDKGTGKFTASVAGLYNFAVHYCTQGSKCVAPEIVHNGKSLQSSYSYGADSIQDCSSMQAYVVMSMGDMVWARSTSAWTVPQLKLDLKKLRKRNAIQTDRWTDTQKEGQTNGQSNCYMPLYPKHKK